MILNKSLPGFAYGLLGLLLILTGASPGNAQQLFTMDAASYRQQGGLLYVEVYFMIQRDRLQFEAINDSIFARCRIELEVLTNDTVLSTTSWDLEDRAPNRESVLSKQKLSDVTSYNLPPGQYSFKGTITDLNAKEAYSRSLNLNLQSFSTTELAISDVELATSVQRSEPGSKFYKNGYQVIPNPERIFGSALPMLYYFAEIYNLSPGEGEYSVDRSIFDNSGKEIKRLPQKIRKKAGADVIDVDGFSIATLISGTYALNLDVKDKVTQVTASRQIKFFIYRPEDFTAAKASSDSLIATQLDKEFQSASESEISEAVEELEYLVTESEYRLAKSLNLEAKRKYLARYWNEHDPNPETTVNEGRIQFLARKNYADDHYNFLNKPGWRSDRGRIFIQNGQPDNIELHSHDLDVKPYEIWYYDSIEAGVEFAFVDRQGSGDYKLVNSTKRGEISRPDWLNSEASIRK
jgi:GWxTD domain-containing protein